jgi:hypothetical protein
MGPRREFRRPERLGVSSIMICVIGPFSSGALGQRGQGRSAAALLSDVPPGIAGFANKASQDRQRLHHPAASCSTACVN